MSHLELFEISEITTQELKQIFNGGLLVRPKVDRSSVTQAGQAFLPKGSVAESLYA